MKTIGICTGFAVVRICVAIGTARRIRTVSCVNATMERSQYVRSVDAIIRGFGLGNCTIIMDGLGIYINVEMSSIRWAR